MINTSWVIVIITLCMILFGSMRQYRLKTVTTMDEIPFIQEEEMMGGGHHHHGGDKKAHKPKPQPHSQPQPKPKPKPKPQPTTIIQTQPVYIEKKRRPKPYGYYYRYYDDPPWWGWWGWRGWSLPYWAQWSYWLPRTREYCYDYAVNQCRFADEPQICLRREYDRCINNW